MTTKAQLAAMTEDELFAGITEALTFGGWRWTHIRRSDGVTVGSSGLPDIIAVHPHRLGVVLAWELKTTIGVLTGDQAAWLAGLAVAPGVDARIVRPQDYDEALRIILANGTVTA